MTQLSKVTRPARLGFAAALSGRVVRQRHAEVGLVPLPEQHLARAAVSIAPLRIEGGTRFKILEAMAMATPVVSTSVGAEGIDAEPGRHLLLGDDAASFAAAVSRVLGDPQLGSRLGREGRALVEERYSWASAAQTLEVLYRQALAAAP